jgi:cytochrome c biogenesis protein CcmG/thiol:disulfide interchange protein DsbE
MRGNEILENRITQYLIVFFAGLWIVGSTVFIKQPEDQTFSAAMEGFKAPDFELEDVQSNLIDLQQFRGQVVLLNLWASWCTPCRAEMPAMEAVYQSLRDQGFTVLAINMSSQDDINQAIGFMNETGITFPVLFDTEGEVERAYSLQALPTSFFIDQKGVIQSIVVGGPMPESLIYSKAVELLEEE